MILNVSGKRRVALLAAASARPSKAAGSAARGTELDVRHENAPASFTSIHFVTASALFRATIYA